MKHAIALAFVLAATPAAAQPRETCAVTIVRAPDDVRAVVERWVAAEPTCTTKLEVRIVPTDGGLYLLARDESGRIRERTVPDAAAAGVIVASWVAADSTAQAAPVQSPYETRVPSGSPVTVPAAAPGAGPGATPPMAVDAESPIAAPQKRERARWFAAGGMAALQDGGGGGLRAEWDVRNLGWIAAGAASSISGESLYYSDSYDPYYYGAIETLDIKLLGYLAATGTSGGWHLRASIGAGGVYTRAAADTSGGRQVAGGIFPTAELALSVGHDLGTRWGIFIGPVVSLYAQTMNLYSADFYDGMTVERDVDTMLYFSVRRRL